MIRRVIPQPTEWENIGNQITVTVLEDFDRRILGTFTKSAHAKIIAELI